MKYRLHDILKRLFPIAFLISFLFASQDTVSINISFNDDPGSISYTPTALRYDKKHAISFDQDDNLRGVYKAVLPLFKGGTPALYVSGSYIDQASSPGRFFNDPFGNHIHFRANTVSWVITDSDQDYWEWATGWPAGGRLGYPDLEEMLENDFGISSHGYYSNIHERGDDTVALCPTFYRNWLEKNTGYVPFSFDQPGGTTYNTTLWKQKWFERGALYGVLNSGGGYATVRVDNVDHAALSGTIITSRYSMENKSYTDLKNTVDQLMSEGDNRWLRCFSHNIQTAPTSFLDYDAFVQFTDYIEDTYADSIWVPGIHEIIEYFHVRDNVSFTTLAGSNSDEKTLQFNTGDIPIYVKHRYLTFILESSASIESIDFNACPANYKSLGDNRYLIDIDLSVEGTAVAEPSISGPTEVPENSNGITYSVESIANGLYEWILTGDATIASGDSTNSITVDFGDEDPEIHVRVSNDDGNAAYDMLEVTTTHVHYVKPVASGDGSGSSWANADDDIQAAMNEPNVNQVWVAAGTYYVSDADGFNPVNGVTVYGGFAGTETDTSDRATSDLDSDGTISPWEFSNQSILSGDLDHASNPDNYTSWPDNIGSSMDGNANHIIYQASGFDNWAAFNGFSFSGGNANEASAPDNEGGAVYIRQKMLIKNCRFMYNIANNKGGAVYSYQSHILNSSFESNRSLYDGGAVYNSGGIVDICNFSNNHALDNGGAVSNYGSEALLRNSHISGNSSDNLGGGVHNYLGRMQDLSVFSNNSASHGGGLYLDQGELEDSRIYSNTAGGSGSGGGVYSYRGRIDDCEIYRNSAPAGGGGALVRGDTISNSFIYDNQITLSYARGGGLSIQDATDQANVVNVVVFNNQSLKYGGGINNENADIVNCTVVNNYSADDAGGIYNNTDAVILNTVIWGNNSANSDPQINTAGTVTYTAVEGSAPAGTGNISLNGDNAADATSPYFIQATTFVGISDGNESRESELSSTDWDIQSASALVNAGTETNAPALDIDGITRTSFDIGAFESTASEVPTPVRLKCFEANLDKGIVYLSWTTGSETENAGFKLYRNSELLAMVEGHGNSTEEHSYSYEDGLLLPGNYEYLLADVNYAGKEHQYTNKTLAIRVSSDHLSDIDHILEDAYPNPFNPGTTFSYTLGENTDVILSIFDIKGRIINTWNFYDQGSGRHLFHWDGRSIQGADIPSGIYFYRISAGEFVETKKAMLMK